MKRFFSSTEEVPPNQKGPRHVAIIMDGNGRWAKQRLLPRAAGHAQGVERVKDILETCGQRGIEYLTLFAFSSENWRRPPEEVQRLMELFVTALEREVDKMKENGVRLKVVGDLSRFDANLQALIQRGEEQTRDCDRLTITVCANYGGRWDILNAVNAWRREHAVTDTLTEEALAPYLALAHAPEPDLFIRTGGEQRISNFLLWQLAYTELYFTDTLWPDFDAKVLNEALDTYQKRERRFGRTSEQLLER
ncbi:MAG TPA: polyprenyl diphosphate synthase [Thiobacillaceae bacterium]|nr:polyprenyl diphosphate synthase [Thiobacillaceae bacterium]HNA82023.1 polyprenyl diphosphate synthase [Thiobacillaceae bacterium]HNF89026.1 polyprenyl diphosphate synthase [Thiobacillaceae bacterium]HNH89182.1 polyprenyl diphosphate synthase [Thiobacillaceae bacterium]